MNYDTLIKVKYYAVFNLRTTGISRIPICVIVAKTTKPNIQVQFNFCEAIPVEGNVVVELINL